MIAYYKRETLFLSKARRKMTMLLSRELFIILSHFPFYALLYSIFLTCIAAFTLLLYDLSGKGMPTDMGENMYSYLTVIVAWLVTTRPAYSLTIHDMLTDLVHTIIEKLHILNDAGGDFEAMCLLYYITLTLGSLPNPEFLHLDVRMPVVQTVVGTEILAVLRTIKMRQRLALPHSLHGLCIILVIGFHGLLIPLILYDNNTWFCLIPNALMAVYTSGCLQVAITISDPYPNVKRTNKSAAQDYFQEQFHVLTEIFAKTNLKKGRKTILTNLQALSIPKPPVSIYVHIEEVLHNYSDTPVANTTGYLIKSFGTE